MGVKGLEVIPLDDNIEFSKEGTLSMTSRPCKVGHTTPGKAAKPFVEAPSAKARDFAVKGVLNLCTIFVVDVKVV